MEVPGNFIATVEELTPGAGVLEEEGKLYAAIQGQKQVEGLGVSIKNSKATRRLAKGDLVYGLIQDVYDSVSLIEFQPVEKNIAVPNNYAYLRISEIQKRYTETFGEHIKIGDFIKAKVVEVKPLGIYLTIAWPELGVVKAFCSNCRKEMKDEGRVFVCRECGSTETRKKAL